MARITVEDCLEKVGNGNRFALVHLAVERIRQHRKGAPWLTDADNSEIVKTLREIASGDVSFDNIKELGKPPEPEVVEEAPDEAETEAASAKDVSETEE